MSTNKQSNRLIHEKSPYLLQHAHNPVDWYPWGEEAFEKAKRENKPVMVSIGYSTCHWCHVMERESFENPEVAEILNERFVAIKVDREERPDLDSVYMSVCQLMTGQGGWPLNVFLTPDRIPFYAGTYFPKESRYGLPGIKDAARQLYDAYTSDPAKIAKVGARIQAAIEPKGKAGKGTDLSVEAAVQGYQELKSRFDPKYGGFGEAPKFPSPHTITFLLRYYKYSGEQDALNMALKTLDGLRRGGIYDHIGFGFSRYSTDELFLVPHFEKMLYDNAMLAIAYTEAYQVTGGKQLKETAEQIFTYVLRDMTHPDGGFYSAEDADSEGFEGLFYLWTPDEIEDVLGEELGELYCAVYDITEDGNFEDASIPNLIREPVESFAVHNQLDPVKLKETLAEARQKLFAEREKREHPYKDDKILTAWNGLMIAALAKASRVFDHEAYFTAASRALQFIENNLSQNGRLMVRYRDGEVKQEGFLDDYAYVLWGLLEMYEASMDLHYLTKAKELASTMITLFWDEENGGFYFTGTDHEMLLTRPKEGYDGALPSGNSVAALQLLRLARLTGSFELEEKVQQLFESFADEMALYPSGHAYMLQAYLTTQMKMKEVVVLASQASSSPFLKELRTGFYPEVTYLAADAPEAFKETAPFASDYSKVNGESTYYICENFICHQPVTNEEEAVDLLTR